MSIQSFTEAVLQEIDKAFAHEANSLLDAARNHTGKESYIAGRLDGMSSTADNIKRVYKTFVKSESEDQEEPKALY